MGTFTEKTPDAQARGNQGAALSRFANCWSAPYSARRRPSGPSVADGFPGASCDKLGVEHGSNATQQSITSLASVDCFASFATNGMATHGFDARARGFRIFCCEAVQSEISALLLRSNDYFIQIPFMLQMSSLHSTNEAWQKPATTLETGMPKLLAIVSTLTTLAVLATTEWHRPVRSFTTTAMERRPRSQQPAAGAPKGQAVPRVAARKVWEKKGAAEATKAYEAAKKAKANLASRPPNSAPTGGKPTQQK